MVAGRPAGGFWALSPAGFAIIEYGSTWNETFLNLYNDCDLGRKIWKLK
jgi:hypothetical protein